MNGRLETLRLRRELLVAQAAAQRSETAYLATQLQTRLRLVDIGFALLRTVRLHPVLIASGAALLLRTPRRRLSLWAGRLVTSWELLQAVRAQWPRREL